MRQPLLSVPLLAATLSLAACVTPLPPHDPGQAWIDMQAQPDTQLGADEVDGVDWPDRRYFQVYPGAHRLQVRFGFEVPGGGLGPSSEPIWRTCILEVKYADFAAGERYRLEVRPVAHRAMGRLLTADGTRVARAEMRRCGAW
jgi:hypothetical protein